MVMVMCSGDLGEGICIWLCIYAFRYVWIVVYDVGGYHMCVVIYPERGGLSLQLCINFMMFLGYFRDNQYDIITTLVPVSAHAGQTISSN